MSEFKKKLPIGIQSFSEIREEGDYYVDKTGFVKQLVDSGKYYFFSRPRRFGKSLFIDTIRWAFSGKKEFFQGLYLEDNWDWEKTWPVIHISFGAGVAKDEKDLDRKAFFLLKWNQEELDVECEARDDPSEFLMQLIYKTHKKYNAKTVVLVDEYDKPILDKIDDKQTAGKIRERLRNFYSVLKDADQYLKFVFITGVSKFSKVSLFSGLNNLQDITLNPDYATLCGYTQQELEQVFEDRLNGVDLEKVKKWYNGYNWLGENVYNPFDLLLYLSEKQYRSFWFETGTPAFLIKLLLDNKYYIPDLENLEVGEELIGSFDIEGIYPENLLFQTGYLTIKNALNNQPMIRYVLTFPNQEVRYSLTNYLLNHFVEDYRSKDKNRTALYRALENNDIEDLKQVMLSFFASIPNDWYRKNKISEYEGYYASIFYCYFTALGLDVIAEDATNYGKIDMTLLYGDRVYIFEFKVVEYLPQGKALQQIKQNRYHEKYMDNYKEINLIGVEFSKEEKNIVNFEAETLKND